MCTTDHVAELLKLPVNNNPDILDAGTEPLIICPPGAILILPDCGDEKYTSKLLELIALIPLGITILSLPS